MPFENMLAASLHVSAWSGVKLDTATTSEVLKAKRAEGDAGKFSKLLVPRRHLAALESAHFAARRDFRRLTLPYDYGMGLVSGDMFEEFREVMVKHRETFDEEARKFVEDVYPGVLEAAQLRLVGLYDASDFPTQQELRGKFRMQLNLFPVPRSAELKLASVSDATEALLRVEYEEMLTEKLAQAQRDVWLRVLEPAAKFAETMASPDAKFRESTVENLREVARLAPRMSLAPDAELQTTCARLLQALSGVSAEQLRKQKDARQEVAVEVKAVSEEISRKLAWMTGTK